MGDYHQAYWREYVFNASKQFKVSLKPNQFVSLVNRWAYFDKSYKIADIKKDYKDKPKFLDWILSTDKNDIEKIFKQNIKPFEVLFFQVGAEILKNISGYMAASPEKATQKIRKEVTCHMAALPIPFRTTKKQPTFFNLDDNNGCTCPAPHGRTFHTALDPLYCNRYEIADFARKAHVMGINYLGVCCGAAPMHIREVAEAIGRKVPASRYREKMSNHFMYGTNERIPDHISGYGNKA